MVRPGSSGDSGIDTVPHQKKTQTFELVLRTVPGIALTKRFRLIPDSDSIVDEPVDKVELGRFKVELNLMLTC